ncbi:MAG: CPBP family intramembrane glutamic endopeptidase [Planctomycetota bacterium]|nr:CPBP family intramembrane glutamic endopeptidase [Planctomycetota bacterium]
MCNDESQSSPGDVPESSIEPRIETSARKHIFRLAVIFEGGLGAAALGLGWLCDFDFLHLETLWSGEAVVRGLLATIPPVIGLLVIDRFPFGPMAELNRVVDELIVPLFRDLNVLQLFIIAALAGIGEELFFRGLLQGGLEHFLRGRMDAVAAAACALLLVSAVFGAAHAITRMYALLCFLMGLYLGGVWMIDSPRNLSIPIVVHGLYDFVALIYLVRLRGSRS